MSKVAIIGVGNVGGLAAARILEEDLADVVLIDIQPNLAEGKALDIEDRLAALKCNRIITGSSDFSQIKDSQIIVITAGFPRQPGMSREELLDKNAKIIKDITDKVKQFCKDATVIVVTNPVDMMTYLFYKESSFDSYRVMGMGSNLDAARFTNLISQELNVPNSDIEACVIGNHGEKMLPLPRFTLVEGKPLSELLSADKVNELVKLTSQRGARIVSKFGKGSAYFAPAAVIANMVKMIIRDEKATNLASVYLNGEYGIKDICLGVPVRLGKQGIQEIIQLDLNPEEKKLLFEAEQYLRKCMICV